jgi:NAD(P)-dependent dehydrogenase (short-subunit alcohol dehydrogenase family)
MQGELSGRHAVVTGGSRGIGAAIARALAGRGATVTVMARHEADAAGAASRMEGDVGALAADVTRGDDVQRAFEAAASRAGPVAILINNVGGMGGMPTASLLQTSEAAWQRLFEVNVQPTVLCTQQVLAGMLQRRSGCIVNVASTAGLRGYAYVSAYVAAKHAVVGLTRALAVELAGSGVGVHAVCPGFVDTEMTRKAAAAVAEKTGQSVEHVLASFAGFNPHRRLVRPDEVGERVVRLCLQRSADTRDPVSVVDGGEENGGSR